MILFEVTLAAEGIVDFAVLRRLVREAKLEPGSEYGRKGKAFLDKQMLAFNQAACFSPWAVARDLDHDAQCAGELAKRVLPAPASLMRFRIVVRSIEAWLLGDRQTFCCEFRVANKHIPLLLETMEDPKATMLAVLSQSASREIRAVMTRQDRSGKRNIGPEYNSRLGAFAEANWRPEVAANSAPSLARARERLAELRELMLSRQQG